MLRRIFRQTRVQAFNDWEMSPLIRFILAATLAFELAGCDLDPTIKIYFAPVIAGAVDVRGDNGRWCTVPLTQEQALLLSRWLEAHRYGWHGLIQTPSPLPSFSFGFESADGRRYSIEVTVNPNGNGGAVVNFRGPKRAPLSRHLSVDEVRTLRAAVGIDAPKHPEKCQSANSKNQQLGVALAYINLLLRLAPWKHEVSQLKRRNALRG
ncbi:hypothetical protein BJN34_21395 [Cupriavidus necator]|uniref:Uncharacterized protein n=2 Tax=Cupriavidus necator TaxID=106590 RepID=A0A1U9UUQ6_CUPNE|nr:hypothetical protein BJN34_21395 [Cupriavidus necator]